MRAFWDGWLAWSRDQGIDYHVGRALAPRLASLGLVDVAGTAETAVYNGALAVGRLLDGHDRRAPRRARGLREARRPPIDAFLAHCADPAWWTQTIAFTAVHARAGRG